MCCKMNIMNQKLYRFDTAFYSIEFSEKYKGIAEADKALRKYYAKFIRMMNDKRFENISFGIGISNQDGQTATKATIKTGDKGRPQIIVTSRETKEWHIHCVVYGNFASAFCQKFIEYYRKKKTSDIRKKKLKHGANYVPYCYNQCISWLTHGTFDFSKLYNALKWKELLEDNEIDLEHENLALQGNELTGNNSNILSYETSDNLSPKAYIVTDFSTFGTVYVIIRVLLYLIYSYPSYITLEIIVKFLERIHLSAIRLFHHALNRFWINFSRFRTDIILQQNEDYQSHIAKPWLSVRFSNDRFWRIIHHIFVAIPYQFVLSS